MITTPMFEVYKQLAQNRLNVKDVKQAMKGGAKCKLLIKGSGKFSLPFIRRINALTKTATQQGYEVNLRDLLEEEFKNEFGESLTRADSIEQKKDTTQAERIEKSNISEKIKAIIESYAADLNQFIASQREEKRTTIQAEVEEESKKLREEIEAKLPAEEKEERRNIMARLQPRLDTQRAAENKRHQERLEKIDKSPQSPEEKKVGTSIELGVHKKKLRNITHVHTGEIDELLAIWRTEKAATVERKVEEKKVIPEEPEIVPEVLEEIKEETLAFGPADFERVSTALRLDKLYEKRLKDFFASGDYADFSELPKSFVSDLNDILTKSETLRQINIRIKNLVQQYQTFLNQTKKTTGIAVLEKGAIKGVKSVKKPKIKPQLEMPPAARESMNLVENAERLVKLNRKNLLSNEEYKAFNVAEVKEKKPKGAIKARKPRQKKP